MVTMTWGSSPPAAGRPSVVRDDFAGADQAVEEPLRGGSAGPGPIRDLGRVVGPALFAPVSVYIRPLSRGAGVGGGVHHGQGGSHWSGSRRFRCAAGRGGSGGGTHLGGGGVLPRTVRTRPGRSPRSSAGRPGTADRHHSPAAAGSVGVPSGPGYPRGQWCRTFSRARVMMVAERDATVPAATAAARARAAPAARCDP